MKQIHLLSSQKETSLLGVLKRLAEDSVGVDFMIHVKAKTDDGVELMDAVFRDIRARPRLREVTALLLET